MEDDIAIGDKVKTLSIIDGHEITGTVTAVDDNLVYIRDSEGNVFNRSKEKVVKIE